MFRDLWRSIRAEQWTKNSLLFAGLIFSGRVRQPWDMLGPELFRASVGFAAFSMLSGATYLVNDLLDRERDRLHPTKRHRPIAAGRLSGWVVGASACTLVLLSLVLAIAISLQNRSIVFAAACLAYLGLSLLYSVVLKHQVIVDVLAIALGFVLRVVAGCLAVPVEVSPWLVLCTMLLALFLGLCKRRHELAMMGEGSEGVREVLPHYSLALLDQMIAVATSTTIMAYALYTFTAPHTRFMGKESPWLMVTIPFVLYGLFRYLYLAYRKDIGGSPERMFKDSPMIVNILLWAAIMLGLALSGR